MLQNDSKMLLNASKYLKMIQKLLQKLLQKRFKKRSEMLHRVPARFERLQNVLHGMGFSKVVEHPVGIYSVLYVLGVGCLVVQGIEFS